MGRLCQSRVGIWIVSLSLTVPAWAAPEALGLKQAMESALKNNPGFRQVQEKVHQSEASQRVTEALLYPTVTAQVNANRQKDALNVANGGAYEGSPYSKYSGYLKVTQPLIQFGTLTAVDSAKKDVALSALGIEIGGRDLESRVISGYYQLILASRNVETLLRQEKIVKEALGVAQSRERSGRGQLLDVYQVKTQLALLRTQIDASKNQVEIAAALFANTIGDSQTKVMKFLDTLEAPHVNVVDAQLDLKKYRIPEIDRENLLLLQLEDQKEMVIGGNLPALSLLGAYSYGADKQSDLFASNANSWVVGLQLTIPIFSGFLSIAQRQAIASQQIQIEFEKKNVLNTTALNQITSRKNLESALSSIQTGEEALKIATLSLNEAKKNYRYSTIDFIQFLNVEQAFVQSEQSLNLYKYNYIIALAQYFVSSGQNLEQLTDMLEPAAKGSGT